MPGEDKSKPVIQSYFRVSESAKASLIFVLPMIVIYELGTWYFTADPVNHTEQRIVAFSMIRDWLGAIGATAYWVAPASVISLLLGQFLIKREKVKLRISTFIYMICESAVLSLPLMMISMLSAKLPLMTGGEERLGTAIVLSIGAGVYEETIFRLVGFAVLHFILFDFLSIRAKIAIPMMVILSAVAFSMYHYLGPEPFSLLTFVFRTLAGIYFGIIMCYRGFGVTAGTHASYDILISIMRELSHVMK